MGMWPSKIGISNEIHVQVASILAACFDDIDLVKRIWPRNPRKSSRVFWGVDGVGEISGRHRLSGWHKGGPVITGMFFRWICCGDSLIIMIHWSCMGTPTQTCSGFRYQMSGYYLKNCLALLPFYVNKKRYIDGFAGVNFPSSHGTGSSARPLGSTGSTEVVRLPYTLEPITQEISWLRTDRRLRLKVFLELFGAWILMNIDGKLTRDSNVSRDSNIFTRLNWKSMANTFLSSWTWLRQRDIGSQETWCSELTFFCNFSNCYHDEAPKHPKTAYNVGGHARNQWIACPKWMLQCLNDNRNCVGQDRFPTSWPRRSWPWGMTTMHATAGAKSVSGAKESRGPSHWFSHWY